MPTDRTVPRSQILPPAHPMRMSMDEAKLEELADSIRKLGVLSPLLVVPLSDAGQADGEKGVTLLAGVAPSAPLRLEILDGHRRYIASGMVGVVDLPVRIFEDAEEYRYAIMLHATACHEEFTPAEEGVQFLELSEKYGWNMDELVRHFRKSEEYINDRAHMVRYFPDVSKHVAAKSVNWSQAKQIMRVVEPERRAYLLEQATTHGASTNTLRYMVEQWKSAALVAAGGQPVHTPEHAAAFVPVDNPRCLWCDRDDDPSNIASVPVHSYHKRDLEELLKKLGIGRVVQASKSA